MSYCAITIDDLKKRRRKIPPKPPRLAISSIYEYPECRRNISDLFIILSEENIRAGGVYSYWIGDQCQYIGSSINIGFRMLESLRTRFGQPGDFDHLPLFARVMTPLSDADMYILEPYYIVTLKPKFNVASKPESDPTIQVNAPDLFAIPPVPVTRTAEKL